MTDLRTEIAKVIDHVTRERHISYVGWRIADAILVLLPQWRTIESAPKDGTPVLIKLSHGIAEAWYSSDVDGDMWIVLDDTCQFEPDVPTHWQPLPLPPEE